MEQVAESLRTEPTNSATLEIVAEIIREGAGAELFRALVGQEKMADGEGTFVSRLMHCFERVMPENPAAGAYLMGRLYGFAWQTSDHATFNGIDLWMHNTASPEAAAALVQLSTEPIRPALKKVCSSWAKLINEKV